TVLKPSRINETSEPASGLPRLSRTVPLIVASDLLEPAASVSVVTKDAMKDTSAIRDKLKPNALLMRQRPPRPKSLFGSHDIRTGSDEETYRNPTKQAVIVRHGVNCCQVIGTSIRHLPPSWGRARIQHPIHHNRDFRPILGFRDT